MSSIKTRIETADVCTIIDSDDFLEPPASAKLCHALWQRAKEAPCEP